MKLVVNIYWRINTRKVFDQKKAKLQREMTQSGVDFSIADGHFDECT